ncbi:IclR family transcriptional regulator [Alicycliphilus denitrificans]|uniref:Transcriptional regulator, IclR family n=1 Tax=Alicycliphilus denitrificans (strain DSM 14773 / CIP 107495 / K601) TaxID=596154 RepID=F4GBM9_ALIDK|nr:IclR family transcriptional regulator [Alicycliphilus denitrificans]AEB86950.1 transcriptional regulator, IclR family [Alicycliphilus denitrificans K601]
MTAAAASWLGPLGRINPRSSAMPAKKQATASDKKKPAARAVRVRPVPAVSRSIAILRLLGRVGQPLGVKAIADELALVPSTCLHILRVLVAEELVTWDPATKRYALGNGMISLARSVLDRSGFPQLIQPVLDRLAGRFGVTAMGVEITAKGTVVVLALSHSNQPFRVHTDVGSRFDTLVSATGRLIAAHGGESWAELRKKFSQIHWDKAPRFDTWKKEVELARTQGFSVDRDNFMAGLTVVAVPVFTAGGRFAYTVVVVGLSSQLTTVATDLLAQEMMREAREISGLLVEGI